MLQPVNKLIQWIVSGRLADVIKTLKNEKDYDNVC